MKIMDRRSAITRNLNLQYRFELLMGYSLIKSVLLNSQPISPKFLSAI